MAQKTRKKTASGAARGLEAAKRKLEQNLIFNVVDEALSAESGTNTHGFENVKGVGISDKMEAGWPTGETCVTVYVFARFKPSD